MSISVKFFASLREQVGKGEAELEAPVATVGEVWRRTTEIPMPANTLMAVNLEYVDADHAVQDGDEVAFFPPVTGG
ncbi:MAG TPA: molybdopterin converting factor subunit 1 [Chromatiales bacterium]|nr:molybdopterin converting factor subunit 1 [Chromatiales bacterium]